MRRSGFKPVSPVGRQRDLIVLTGVLDPVPSPDLPADVDDLAGASQRRVERDAVKPSMTWGRMCRFPAGTGRRRRSPEPAAVIASSVGVRT